MEWIERRVGGTKVILNPGHGALDLQYDGHSQTRGLPREPASVKTRLARLQIRRATTLKGHATLG